MTKAPVRMTVTLAAADSRRLIHARGDDGVPASQRIRAAVQLWRDDPSVRAQIDAAAAAARAARLQPGSADAAAKKVKVTVLMDPTVLRDLWAARSQDKVSTTARIRAAVGLWSTDSELRTRIDTTAKELHQAQRARPEVARPA